MEFQNRKAAALAAINSTTPDKSPKGTIDAPIIHLLTAINSHSSYFTTSSCSGRISVLSQPIASPSAPKKKARGGSWLFISHESVQPSSLIAVLFAEAAQRADSSELASIVFRYEPLIIAVECENVDAAQSLVSLAISSGFRESGITSVSKRVIIAIRCSIRLEVPLGDTQKLMVSPEYVDYLVQVANEKMEANRNRTDSFYNKLIGNGFLGHEIRDNCEETEKLEVLGNAMENESEVLERETKYTHNSDNGSEQVFGIDLSVIEVVGEPVERLFLWGHSTCTINQKKIIVFGGFGGIGRHARRNDLLLFDPTSGVLEIIATAGAPSPRLGHTSSLIGDSMYVIGGRADPTNILSEVWAFNTVKNEWKLLQCSGSLFPPRHRHAASVVGSKIYVYGGIHDDAILSSIYVLDSENCEWSEVESHGDQPGPLHSHSMVAAGSKLYVFGGNNGDSALCDLYSFDIETSLWSKLKTSGQSPNARFSHLMFMYSDYIGILGGCPITEHQKLFLLDFQSLCWKNVTVKSIEESLFVRSTINIVGNDMIILGGGASCYAFGTKFSEPMKINLLHLMSLEELVDNLEQKSSNGHNKVDSEFEDSRVTSKVSEAATPCILLIEKQYAKLGKDMLKKFGWLDLERKVYSHDDGIHICLPVTEKFCCVLEKEQASADKLEPVSDLQSIKSLKDISSSAALNLLIGCGSTMIVDEVVKVKKTPNSPFKVMKEVIASLLSRHGLPEELIEELPSRWEKLGDIIVLPVMSFKDQIWESIGEQLWPLVAQSLGTRRLARQGRIAATGTRDSRLEILVGDNGWVEHCENGILYSFDATKCMFSWGNLSEKLRMARLDCRGQVVVDLFAGIGYFTLPFLVRGSAKMVYACEWNPHAIEALHRNLRLNSVAEDRCSVLEGDNTITAPKGVADRVCLGLLPSSECSWVTAVRALRDDGGMLHIHGNVKDSDEGSWTNHVVQSISDIAKSQGHLWEVSVDHLERVKWYAPHIRHVVVDVRCGSIER